MSLLGGPDSPMRVLDVAVVAPNIRRGDGQGRIILEIARTFCDEGHRVTAYSWSCPEELTSRPDFHWVRLKRPFGPDLTGIFSFPMMATRALKGRPHDVVCTMGPCALPDQPVVYYAPFTQLGWRREWARVGRPGVVPQIASAASSWVERRAVTRARAVVGMSSRVLGELAPLISQGAHSAVVPGGVDLSEFEPAPLQMRELVRKELGIEDRFAIAIVGEYSTGRKGHELLADALGDGDVMLVKGSGARKAQTEIVRILGSEGKVVFIDQSLTPTVQEVIAAADAVAIPSLYEPFSLVALEAAASASPILISRTAGAADVLDGAALLVDPQVSSIREAIMALKQDPAMARELGSKARRVAESHGWDQVTLGVVRLAEVVASESSPN